MRTITQGIIVLLLGMPAAAGDEGQSKSATPSERHQALAKEFQEAARAFYVKSMSDEERSEPEERIVDLSPRCLELAEKYPTDPIAHDALLQAIVQELWLVNNSDFPGRGDDNIEAKAITILLRDHILSERLGEACRRLSYGFSKDCETFLRTVLEKSPHREVRALASLRLAQFLKGRLERLDLLKERPDMTERYEGIFGKDFVASLRRKDRAEAVKEIEAAFERAMNEYGDVKVPYRDTVRTEASSNLHEIRRLSVGKQAPEIDGQDQDGKRFKLSDYRGKVVLLYFWSEY